MKIEVVNYQRNGVSGIAFYVATFTQPRQQRADEIVIVTFETDESDKYAVPSTTRAVMVNKPTESWRGDHYADYLNSWFQVRPEKTFYDLLSKSKWSDKENSYKAMNS